MKPPLRLIIKRGAGTDQLECGHIIDHRPNRAIKARCVCCLPLVERLAHIRGAKT